MIQIIPTVSEPYFNLKWSIPEDRLKVFKDSTNFESLTSKTCNVIQASDVEYWLEIYPNGQDRASQGECMIFLNMSPGKEYEIETDYTISIESARFNRYGNNVFKEYDNKEKGFSLCTSEELFDPEKKFIVDGMLVVKLEGILKIENDEPPRKILKAKRKISISSLWDSGFEDFTIVADGKEIKIHKCIFACQSSVFAAMFKPHTKEAIENKVEIPEFSFRIVEKAVKLCYHQINISDISMDDIFLLLKFTDIYDISILKDNLEAYLVDNLTPSNVCEVVKNTSDANVLTLRKKCIDFITNCISQKKPVPNMELLDNAFFVTVCTNLVWTED